MNKRGKKSGKEQREGGAKEGEEVYLDSFIVCGVASVSLSSVSCSSRADILTVTTGGSTPLLLFSPALTVSLLL